MQLLTVVGARPQFIKAAAVSRSIAATASTERPIKEKILHTGQHYDVEMSDRFFSELGIPTPTYNLGIGGGSHAQNTGRMLEAIENILLKELPSAVLVYGDTDSTLAGALAASKLNIPILHIEAGLRSFSRCQPEEQNRILTDHLADLCFAPTETAVYNLQREGISEDRIVQVGDVMADSARIFGLEAESRANDLLTGIPLTNCNFILSTIHRKENTDSQQRLTSILEALGSSPLPVLLPLHPRTLARIKLFGLENLLEDLFVVPPLGFLTMLLLERRATLVVTDSGGVQKEAFLQGTPCVTTRSETEWVELVECGWNHLAKPESRESILEAIHHQLSKDINENRPLLYGDGNSSMSIITHLQDSFP